jgi:hypothetical protein
MKIKNQQEYLMNDNRVVRVWEIGSSFIYVLIRHNEFDIGKFQSWTPDMWKLEDFVTMVKDGMYTLIKDSKTRKGAIEI